MATHIRSFLFIPGDSEKKLSKGAGTGADALILDLEDSVSQDRLPLAREMVREYLAARPDRSKQQLWVRINPLSGALDRQSVAVPAKCGGRAPTIWCAASASPT